MRSTRSTPVLLLLLLLAGWLVGCSSALRVTDDWKVAQHDELGARAADLHERGNVHLRLSLSSAGLLDADTLLLGGSYRTPAASVRSVLLRSTDGGQTWHDTEVWLTGSDTGMIFVLDTRHAWAVVNWSIEGWLGPFSVFRTTDGGATWTRSRDDLPLNHIGGIPLDAEIRFASPAEGQFWIHWADGTREHYTTRDGGLNWRRVHVVRHPVYDDIPSVEIGTEGERDRIIVRIHHADMTRGVTQTTLRSTYRLHADGQVTRDGDP